MNRMLFRLNLTHIREIYQEWIDRSFRKDMGYRNFLEGLLHEEIIARDKKRIRNHLKKAGFPVEKTLEKFDFVARLELRYQVFLNYLQDSFIKQLHSLCFNGPSDLGKTHISTEICISHTMLGYDVCFKTIQVLMHKVLQASERTGRHGELKLILQCDLLFLDDSGYLPMDPEIGPVLYEIVAGRYEKKALVIKSNKRLTELGQLLHDGSLDTAIVDRIMHQGEVYYLSGPSYRMRGKKITGSGDARQESISPEKSQKRKEMKSYEGLNTKRNVSLMVRFQSSYGLLQSHHNTRSRNILMELFRLKRYFCPEPC